MDDQVVPRKSAARRKHPHFTHSELRLILDTFFDDDKPDATRIYWKAKAALAARGVEANRSQRRREA